MGSSKHLLIYNMLKQGNVKSKAGFGTFCIYFCQHAWDLVKSNMKARNLVRGSRVTKSTNTVPFGFGEHLFLILDNNELFAGERQAGERGEGVG